MYSFYIYIYRGTLIFEAKNIRQDASTCHKSHALCAMQKYCALNVVSRNWMLAEVPFISLYLSLFLLHKAAYACTPAIEVKLAELSIRGTYAVDLIHEKRRPYFQAVRYCKIVHGTRLRIRKYDSLLDIYVNLFRFILRHDQSLICFKIEFYRLIIMFNFVQHWNLIINNFYRKPLLIQCIYITLII